MAFNAKGVAGAESAQTKRAPEAPQTRWMRGIFKDEQQAWMRALLAELELREDPLIIAGETKTPARWHDFRADEGKSYTYSGALHEPKGWTPTLSLIKQKVEALTGSSFNACLCNYYADGAAGMGWHADKELELGERPTIASVSLGASRLFRFRRRSPWRDQDPTRWDFMLEGGDLLIMEGDTQQFFEHELPKRAAVKEPRLNLTFRRVW